MKLRRLKQEIHLTVLKDTFITFYKLYKPGPKMIKGLPKEVREALKVLWDYSDDACFSGGTIEELDEEGYECSGELGGYYITFVISYDKSKEI